MTDRELLELAALAARYKVQEKGRRDGAFIVLTDDDGDWIWSPLTDDRDALRLAVALGMRLDLDGDLAEASASGCGAKEQFYERSKDKADAARRAMVRCAAEIGKKTVDYPAIGDIIWDKTVLK